MRPPIYGLTLLQPWATLLAHGVKVHETRSWPTAYRGWIAIHAGRRFDAEQRGLARAARRWLRPYAPTRLPLGAILAIGRIVTCVAADTVSTTALDRRFGDFSAGRFAWRFADVQILPTPIPARGALSLWPVPPGLRLPSRKEH